MNTHFIPCSANVSQLSVGGTFGEDNLNDDPHSGSFQAGGGEEVVDGPMAFRLMLNVFARQE